MKIQDAFQAGSGTMSGLSGSNPFGPVPIGAKAGRDQKGENPNVVQMMLVIQSVPMTATIMVLNIPDKQFLTGKPIDLGGFFKGGTVGAMVSMQMMTGKFQVVGLLWDGTITLSEAGLTKGQAIVGTYKIRFSGVGQK